MKKRYVLPADHYPTRLPVLSSVVIYMAMDMYDAPGWLWGALWSLMGLIWFAAVTLWWHQETKPLPGYGEQKDKA